ncbi:hypothetical protein KUTeg_012924 [Tegillarca granosa]|uniref:Uncharacterized protein n=1 Tax=Tegillarca granosa TaxID=220873 RepID=A0ABQ9EWC2_TEGGR|nr:hypothetical protein KUTeg_012924 [Tegillarca granosa]
MLLVVKGRKKSVFVFCCYCFVIQLLVFIKIQQNILTYGYNSAMAKRLISHSFLKSNSKKCFQCVIQKYLQLRKFLLFYSTFVKDVWLLLHDYNAISSYFKFVIAHTLYTFTKCDDIAINMKKYSLNCKFFYDQKPTLLQSRVYRRFVPSNKLTT